MPCQRKWLPLNNHLESMLTELVTCWLFLCIIKISERWSYREKLQQRSLFSTICFWGSWGRGSKPSTAPTCCHLIDLVTQGFLLAELFGLLGIASNIQTNSDIFLLIFLYFCCLAFQILYQLQTYDLLSFFLHLVTWHHFLSNSPPGYSSGRAIDPIRTVQSCIELLNLPDKC